jgi:hypothetical protein
MSNDDTARLAKHFEANRFPQSLRVGTVDADAAVRGLQAQPRRCNIRVAGGWRHEVCMHRRCNVRPTGQGNCVVPQETTALCNKMLSTDNVVEHVFACNDETVRASPDFDVSFTFSCSASLSNSATWDIMRHRAVQIPLVHLCVWGPHADLADIVGYLKQHGPIWALVCRDEEHRNPAAMQAFGEARYGVLPVSISPHELGIPRRQAHTWYVMVHDVNYWLHEFPQWGVWEERFRDCAKLVDVFKKAGGRGFSLSDVLGQTDKADVQAYLDVLTSNISRVASSHADQDGWFGQS